MCGTINGRAIVLRAVAAALFAGVVLPAAAGEPPVIDPFAKTPSQRNDVVPGYVELSDGASRDHFRDRVVDYECQAWYAQGRCP